MTDVSYPIEFERVIAALNESGQRYVIVGGVAVVLHGVDRLTADLDVVLDLDHPGLEKVLAGLAELGYQPHAPVALSEFADVTRRREWQETKRMQVFSLWDPANRLPVLDLFLEAPLEFERLDRNAQEMDLDGLAARVASIDDLITMKRAAGRPQDLADVTALGERRNG